MIRGIPYREKRSRRWVFLLPLVTPLVMVCLILLLGLVACGGDSSPTVAPTPTPPAKAIIGVLLDPSPIMATPSGDPDYPWAFRVNLQVSDSGGVGFIVSSMQTTVTAASHGFNVFDSRDNFFDGIKIPAHGQHTVSFGFSRYRMDFAKTRQGTITFRMNFLDDNGFPSASDASVEIR